MSGINITPTVFKSAFLSPTAAGDSAAWTPAAGKKFRVLRVIFEFPYSNNAPGGKLFSVTLKDGAALLSGFKSTIWVPATVQLILGAYVIDREFGNGVLSAAADNVLSLTVDGSLNQDANCGFRVIIMGTEE
jgi:hypothetical protein